ncbi:MAG: hypothetical protein HY402_01705 [Elusimicrobia bacterium]|nr:hypothetical protein [Elusimicrobiota bacterium]
MAKKDRKRQPEERAPGKSASEVSKRGWRVIGLGIGLLVVGFYLLTFTDPMGQNWASHLSPFVILGGYAAIAIGILLPEKSSAQASSTPHP